MAYVATDKATVHLVSDQTGVYSYQSLARAYPLFISDFGSNKYAPLIEWLFDNASIPNETLETVFNPDNSGFCENVDYLSIDHVLAVQHANGEYWRIESNDGDLIAINPKALWDDEADQYVMGARDNT